MIFFLVFVFLHSFLHDLKKEDKDEILLSNEKK